jgi:hypothetical protein
MVINNIDMKTYFIQLASILFLFSTIQAQNVGIGTTAPLSQLSVGSSSQFRVNSTGNLIRINNIPYSFPSAQGTNQYLKNDGSGNLTWSSAPRAVVRVFSAVPGPGFASWLIDDTADYVSGSNADPTLVLCRGLTYQFSINAPGHPFFITNTPGIGSFGTGVTNNGATMGTITFTVPMDAPSTLYYYCGVHAAMNGTITIL